MKSGSKNLVMLLTTLTVLLTAKPLNAELVALWQFEWGSANDSCGNAYGAVHGSPEWVAGPGGKGGALKFSGEDYISIDNRSKFNITEEITVAAWIKVTVFDTQWQTIIAKGDSSWRLSREAQKGTVAFHMTGVTSYNTGRRDNLGVESLVDVNDGKWHHLVGVYDGSKAYMYIDGVLERALDATGTVSVNTRDVCIGENIEARRRYFQGIIDDVAVFNHALKPAEIGKLYKEGGKSFLPESYAAKLVEEAEAKTRSLKPEEAAAFLEKKIAEYQDWRDRQRHNIDWRDEHLPSDLYFFLAGAKEAAGAPKQEVIDLYKKAASRAFCQSSHVPAALDWLFKNVSNKDYVATVKRLTCNTTALTHSVYHIAREFQAARNWDAFRPFLDGLFAETDYGGRHTYYCLTILAKALEGNDQWTQELAKYCKTNAELTAYLFSDIEAVAKQHMAESKPARAAEVYREIIRKCGPNPQQRLYQMKLFECLMNDGQYETVIREIESFIKENKTSHAVLVIKAIMLKGQAHIHTGDIDSAIDTFFTLLIEYPEAKQAVDANFFMGYCYMLQGEFQDAKESFNIIVQGHPESQYAPRARSYLDRIKKMVP